VSLEVTVRGTRGAIGPGLRCEDVGLAPTIDHLTVVCCDLCRSAAWHQGS
jgi:hypothetical protein